jgi:hypothetical protein
MQVRVILEPGEDGGYTLTNIREAIQLYLEPVEDDMALAAEGEVVEIAV